MKGSRRGRQLLSLLAVGFFLVAMRASSADTLSKTMELVMQGNLAAAKSQARIDKLSEETGDMLAKYRTVQQQLSSIRVYNEQVEKMLVSQRSEITSLEGQIERATTIGREITPLMMRMIEALEAFVKLDIPFLPDERATRMKTLRETLDRADVADSEKFRQVLEAYRVENEYGRSIEPYPGRIEIDGKERSVNFLRVGRILLMYQSPDGKAIGYWNRFNKKWEKLPAEYRQSIKDALRIAQKKTAPNLVTLPVPAPEEAP